MPSGGIPFQLFFRSGCRKTFSGDIVLGHGVVLTLLSASLADP